MGNVKRMRESVVLPTGRWRRYRRGENKKLTLTEPPPSIESLIHCISPAAVVHTYCEVAEVSRKIISFTNHNFLQTPHQPAKSRAGLTAGQGQGLRDPEGDFPG